MRSEADIKKLIIDAAVQDNRVRAVLMNGSRANPNVIPDKLQDFDVVFIVTNLRDFTRDHSWVNVFGSIMLRQLPDEMILGTPAPDRFRYLMLLEDGNRIDITLYPVKKTTKNYWPDSLTVCLLDKDNQFESLPLPNESDYFIKCPSAKEFGDVCNEFWWVSTYVAKGLLRNEITYAKAMLETVVRPMFMQVMEWKIGTENQFSVSFGKAGRCMHQYVPDGYYKSILQTYCDADPENNWQALFTMVKLFEQAANEVATKLAFSVDQKEQENAVRYLRQLYTEKDNR